MTRCSKSAPFGERLAAKIEPEPMSGCWLWSGAISPSQSGKWPYGIVQARDGKMRMAHRVVYEERCGSIPAGHDLDHLCRNTLCVNPAHMEPVTHKENIRRGRVSEVTKARNAAITHCPQGHPYAGGNLYLKPDGVSRECRQCVRDSGARYRAKRRGEQRLAA